MTEACWELYPQTPTHHINFNSIPTAIQIVSTSISTDILIYFSNTSLYTMFFVFASVSSFVSCYDTHFLFYFPLFN